MDHFTYKNSVYHAEDVSLAAIAEAVGTPFYCYSAATLTHHAGVMHEALAELDHKICFAVKANNNLAVLKTLAQAGLGADVVSGGEIQFALAAGMKADDIVFSGVAKTTHEMATALDVGIYQFNLESEAELHQLSEVACSKGKTAAIAFRVNPDVDANTHAKIATGHKASKFGVPIDDSARLYALAANSPNIKIQGISMHIGSQLIELRPFEQAFAHLRAKVVELRAAGHTIQSVDVGGGLGVPYGKENPPTPAQYARTVVGAMRGLDATIVFEPGRVIAANAGVLVAGVTYIKDTGSNLFLIIDAGMNDLIRPAMYEAHHEIMPLHEKGGAPKVTYDIVGPVCESSDFFARARPMPQMQPDDAVVIRSAGAYGAVIASTYNLRPHIPEILVSGDQFAVTRPRQTVQELLANYEMPSWL